MSGIRPLRIMTFNLWRGGIQVDLGQIAAAIRAADPDIVGLQEPEGNTRRLAEMLNWPFVDEGLHLIARHPIYRLPIAESETVRQQYGTRAIALIEVAPGAAIALVNVHLASDPYGPAELGSGRSDAEVAAIETEARLAELREPIAELHALAMRGIPAFLIGDFNVPSHLDWTDAARRHRPEVVRAFRWPVSSALEEAGFRDSYRDAHPDSAARPGITYSPGCPHPRKAKDVIPDRIDFIMAAGPSRTVESRIVGESDGPHVDIGLLPWASDHRAVLSSFDLAPAFPGDGVTVDRAVVMQGDTVVLRYLSALGGVGWRVGIQTPAGDLLESMELGDGTDRRAIAFGTSTLAPGEYDAVLIGPDDEPRAQRRFFVLDRFALPEVGAVQEKIAAGEPIRVRWRHAPANRYDWIGLYRAHETDPTRALAHAYTGAAAFGEIALARRAGADAIAAGDYELRLMRDDAYVTLARAALTIG